MMFMYNTTTKTYQVGIAHAPMALGWWDVLSIIYYLSFARHNREILRQKASNYINSITDAQDYSELSDTDSESSDDDNINIIFSLAWFD